ncbi:MAG TPA: hypothetical protein VHE55_10050 [Fimbriimonadaceae bacterium]|nr:hypothetical protein [Fimbriimonadaceae bacterium]
MKSFTAAKALGIRLRPSTVLPSFLDAKMPDNTNRKRRIFIVSIALGLALSLCFLIVKAFAPGDYDFARGFGAIKRSDPKYDGADVYVFTQPPLLVYKSVRAELLHRGWINVSEKIHLGKSSASTDTYSLFRRGDIYAAEFTSGKWMSPKLAREYSAEVAIYDSSSMSRD